MPEDKAARILELWRAVVSERTKRCYEMMGYAVNEAAHVDVECVVKIAAIRG